MMKEQLQTDSSIHVDKSIGQINTNIVNMNKRLSEEFKKFNFFNIWGVKSIRGILIIFYIS